MKTTNKVLMVEGVSDLAYLGALDHRIGDLSAQRTGFLSAAHELAHYVLDWDGANSTGNAASLGRPRSTSRLRTARAYGLAHQLGCGGRAAGHYPPPRVSR